MRVDVVTSGESVPLYFDVPDSTQIFELLCMIGTSRDIPSWRLRVVHSGRVLSRDASLAQLELRDGFSKVNGNVHVGFGVCVGNNLGPEVRHLGCQLGGRRPV